MQNELLDLSTSYQYEKVIDEARKLMKKKNHDYGDSWRQMRQTTITDQMLVKIHRVVQIEMSNRQEISDSIRNEYLDILNYAVFGIIKLDEEKK